MATRKPSWWRFRVPRARPVPGRWAIALGGLAASFALHALLIEAALLAQPGVEKRNAPEGLGANAVGSAAEAVMTMFFVEDASASERPREDIASAGRVLQSLRVTIVGMDPSLDAALRDASTDAPSSTSDDASLADREARATLFSRYIGQIQARVERAWQRPRSPIGADLFECRAQVQQARDGTVQEVTLKECNGDTRWQLSLVSAIQDASPLPAPPDPSVFGSSLQLNFNSVGYSPTASQFGFEAARAETVSTPHANP